MTNLFNPGSNNADVEDVLSSYPDKVADALQAWRISTLEREKVEALLFVHFKASDDRTVQEVRSLINSDPGRYEAVLNEIKAESEYNRFYEKLLSAKKLASLRTAF